MSEKAKKAFNVNVVDILITAMIVCAVAFAALMLANAFGVTAIGGKENNKIEYTIQLKGILDEFEGNVAPDDTIVDGKKRYNIGEVVSVKVEDYYLDVYDEDKGVMTKVEYPDHSTMYITVLADGYKRDGRYYLKSGDMNIAIGTEITMHAPDLCGIGYVSSVTVVEQ